jgi:hypothetical protein
MEHQARRCKETTANILCATSHGG